MSADKVLNFDSEMILAKFLKKDHFNIKLPFLQHFQ